MESPCFGRFGAILCLRFKQSPLCLESAGTNLCKKVAQTYPVYIVSSNVSATVEKRLAEGRPLPDIFLACGSEDFLFAANSIFDKFLTDKGVAHEFKVSPGIHNWKFWNEWLEPAIIWALS